MRILDYMKKEDLQKVVEGVNKAAGIAITIEDVSGKPIGKTAGHPDENAQKATENIMFGNERVGRVIISTQSGVPKTDDELSAAAFIVADGIKSVALANRFEKMKEAFDGVIKPELEKANQSVIDITGRAKKLEDIASKQNILTLNASIEAARAGTAGAGFAVVAHQMGDMSKSSGAIYGDIEKDAHNLKEIMGKIGDAVREDEEYDQ